jgi:phospholipase/carboxylesterase
MFFVASAQNRTRVLRTRELEVLDTVSRRRQPVARCAFSGTWRAIHTSEPPERRMPRVYVIVLLAACSSDPREEPAARESRVDPPREVHDEPAVDTSRDTSVDPPVDPPPSIGVVWRGSADPVAPLVVLMHGFGARGDDLVPLASRLATRLPDVSFACLAAPHGHRNGGRRWFDSLAELASSRRDVIEWLDAHRRERVVLAGFSQGAIMSIDIALAWDGTVAGIGALSGAPPDRFGWQRDLSRHAPSLFMSHGRTDRVLSFAAAERVADRFREAHAEVRFVAFDGGHSIPPEVIDAFVVYLEERIR